MYGRGPGRELIRHEVSARKRAWAGMGEMVGENLLEWSLVPRAGHTGKDKSGNV